MQEELDWREKNAPDAIAMSDFLHDGDLPPHAIEHRGHTL
jgi:hypothetical protein